MPESAAALADRARREHGLHLVDVEKSSGADALEPEREPVFATLRDLLEKHGEPQSPIEVAHRLAYGGRCGLLCSGDKGGKSTMVATGASAVTRGRSFLGRPTFKGRVLWVGLEEHQDDAVRRFHDLDADPDLVELAIARPRTLLGEIRERLRNETFVWTIVDSVTEYARVTTGGEPPSEGDSSGWSIVARPLARLAHETGVAVTALHHVRRDGEERGSTELFAAVDFLWRMSGAKSGEDPRTRHFKGRGRRGIDMSDFAARWDGGQYDVIGGRELSLDARVLLFIEGHPSSSTNAVRSHVGGRAADTDRALRELEARGAVRNNGSAKGAAWISNQSRGEDA